MLLLLLAVSVNWFSGWAATDYLDLYGDALLEFFSLLGQLHLGQIIFGPLPPSKNPL